MALLSSLSTILTPEIPNLLKTLFRNDPFVEFVCQSQRHPPPDHVTTGKTFESSFWIKVSTPLTESQIRHTPRVLEKQFAEGWNTVLTSVVEHLGGLILRGPYERFFCHPEIFQELRQRIPHHEFWPVATETRYPSLSTHLLEGFLKEMGINFPSGALEDVPSSTVLHVSRFCPSVLFVCPSQISFLEASSIDFEQRYVPYPFSTKVARLQKMRPEVVSRYKLSPKDEGVREIICREYKRLGYPEGYPSPGYCGRIGLNLFVNPDRARLSP